MGKKAKLPRPVPEHERTETHMQLFRRLAAITNMHNHPGAPKPKGGGK